MQKTFASFNKRTALKLIQFIRQKPVFCKFATAPDLRIEFRERVLHILCHSRAFQRTSFPVQLRCQHPPVCADSATLLDYSSEYVLNNRNISSESLEFADDNTTSKQLVNTWPMTYIRESTNTREPTKTFNRQHFRFVRTSITFPYPHWEVSSSEGQYPELISLQTRHENG